MRRVLTLILSFVAGAPPGPGHGVYDRSGEPTYYYLTHGADPSRLRETAADFALVEELLQGIPPRSKLFIMDTCESGDADELAQAAGRAPANLGVAARGLKAFGPSRAAASGKGRPWLLRHDRDWFVFNDLLRRSGAVVFSSSLGGELLRERRAEEWVVHVVRVARPDDARGWRG